MPETLKALYYGNISPFEAPIPAGSPLRKLVPKLAKCETELTDLLDEDGKQLLKEFDDLHQQVAGINSEENFIQGFRLGVRLMAECLTEPQGGDPNG